MSIRISHNTAPFASPGTTIRYGPYEAFGMDDATAASYAFGELATDMIRVAKLVGVTLTMEDFRDMIARRIMIDGCDQSVILTRAIRVREDDQESLRVSGDER